MPSFADLADYVAIPRVESLTLGPQGDRLIATVATLSHDRKRYLSALWEIDPAGVRPARRLTRSAAGERGVAFRPDGSVLFVSERAEADAEPAAEEAAGLWQLPAYGGEAQLVAALPGGVCAVAVARDSGRVVLAGSVLPRGELGTDDQRRTARREAGVAAVLFESSPVRFWDHYLGPGEVRLFAAELAGEGLAELRDLTPDPGRALDEQAFTVTPDGATVLAGWSLADEPGYPRSTVVAIDAASGVRRTLLGEAGYFYTDPKPSPDGRWVVAGRVLDGSYAEPPDRTLWLLELASGAGRDLTPALDRWPGGAVWAADSTALFFVADEAGHTPVYRLELATGEVTRLTASGHHESLCVAPDGTALYALRSAVDSPPTPVRLDQSTPDQQPVPLPAPGSTEPPGRLTELSAVAADGTPLRAWLVLPQGASAGAPAPLLLWIHGGPLSSWNGWSWRWNPWLAAARGYAVLLPDPALSTGYGQDFIRRGWGQWGGTPYTDLISMTDAAVVRPDIDAEHTAAMGGSYGGYLANWVGGHTDRFRCLVTHAGLWSLEGFQATTDHPGYWIREWGVPAERPERYAAWSPDQHAARIRTPVLVIHGERDYRVPLAESLRLWWDLQRYGVDSKFLYFPDEHHWVLKPGNAIVWYETVFAWLDTHLRDQPWRRPALL